LRKLGLNSALFPLRAELQFEELYTAVLSLSLRFSFSFFDPFSNERKEKKRRGECMCVQHIGGRDSSVLLTRSLEIQTNQRAANNLPLASPPALLFSFLFAAFSTLCRVLKKKKIRRTFFLFLYKGELTVYIHTTTVLSYTYIFYAIL
jgi:hypothetical protein